MSAAPPRFVLRIVALYALGAFLWILFSDQLVSVLASDLEEATWMSELKGLLFIVVSSALLFLVLARLARQLNSQSDRLHEVAQRYQTLFEHGGEPMLVVGAEDGLIHEVNHAAVELYGWSANALIGRPLEHLVTTAPDDFSPDVSTRVAHWHRTAAGDPIPVDLVSDAMRWKGDAVHLVVVRDLGDQLAQRARLSRLAHQDPLTGLFNRNLLPEQARMGMANAQRTGTLFAVCFIDLDGFKEVNDRLGHDAGDQLLQEVARRIKAQVRGGDVVVRLGGDEFVVLLGELHSLAECEQVLRRLLASIAEPITLGEAQGRVTGSIGVAVFPADGDDHDALLRAADEAMYRAKASGRNRFVFFNEAHEKRLGARGNMLDRVARAVRDQELRLVYEPVVDTTRAVTVSLEAKMRWLHPVLGVLPASDFLPFIKAPALEHEVDLWAIGQVGRDCSGRLPPPVGLRLNLFAPADSHDALLAALSTLTQTMGRDVLTIELSAEVVRRMSAHLAGFRDACRALGVRVCLDGLVAGADSVHGLATIGVDEFKLPAEALGLNGEVEGLAVLACSYAALATAAGMDMVVKAVKTDADSRWLARHGCRWQQGSAFGAPVEAAQLDTLLNRSPGLREQAIEENET